MRKLRDSRTEFNRLMIPYIALIVQKDHVPFSDNFFDACLLVRPKVKVEYTPPSWAGATYSVDFALSYQRDINPRKWRDESVPEIDSRDKYLVCDDYVSSGETFANAISALVKKGVDVRNIWCFSKKGNEETLRARERKEGFGAKEGPLETTALLDESSEWLNYRRNYPQERSAPMVVLMEKGFVYPSMKANKRTL